MKTIGTGPSRAGEITMSPTTTKNCSSRTLDDASLQKIRQIIVEELNKRVGLPKGEEKESIPPKRVRTHRRRRREYREEQPLANPEPKTPPPPSPPSTARSRDDLSSSKKDSH